MICFANPTALALMTDEQRARINRLVDQDHATKVMVALGGFDLPAGYLAVRIAYNGDDGIDGGISPDGRLST